MVHHFLDPYFLVFFSISPILISQPFLLIFLRVLVLSQSLSGTGLCGDARRDARATEGCHSTENTRQPLTERKLAASVFTEEKGGTEGMPVLGDSC